MQKSQVSSVNGRVYLDHNATTPHSATLRSRWTNLSEIFGNPSSIHQSSRLPKTILRETRNKISDLLGCSALEIIFNSGASEGNSSILFSVYSALSKTRNEYLISSVEHPSVIKSAQYLEKLGAIIYYIPVNRDGYIDMDFIKSKLSNKTALVSVMYANNETGTVFPIKEISSLAHEAGALMHSDCVQALGKIHFNFKELNLNYATFSAHKFYSIKGTGFCYISKNSPWTPLIHGGGQERNRRGGTENIIGIAALNIVLDEIKNCELQISDMKKLRDLMEILICSRIEKVKVTAKSNTRISNTSSLVIEGVDGETLLMSLDLKGFSVSTGAACSSGSPEPSPVLIGMGLTRQEAQSSLRISLGWENTEAQVKNFVDILAEVVTKLREINFKEKIVSNAKQ